MTEMIRQLEKEKLSGLIYIGGNFAPVSRDLFRQLPCPTIFIDTVCRNRKTNFCIPAFRSATFRPRSDR